MSSYAQVILFDPGHFSRQSPGIHICWEGTMSGKGRIIIVVVVMALSFMTVAQRSVSLASQPGQGQTVHVVRAGDTLYGLAVRYGTTIAGIKRANGLSNSIIIPGQRLAIPASAPALSAGSSTAGSQPTARGAVLVGSGATLSSVASRFGVTVTDLKQVNGLSGDRIYAGQSLIIPKKRPPPASPSWQTTGYPGTGENVLSRSTVCGSIYVVGSGDTLSSIANRCHASVASLVSANGLQDTSIWRGQYLVIPGGQAPQDTQYQVQSSGNIYLPGMFAGLHAPLPTPVPAFFDPGYP
ncbi:MAG: LysM peptidoglycan-binding domain-containing protein [Chloroflexota bacterium]|nr:LysM peptidoglycan-binding domain-containing protein [Chloroflexota bacterium]